jgi:hypothetical protein
MLKNLNSQYFYKNFFGRFIIISYLCSRFKNEVIMASKKFTIDEREYSIYELSNEQIVRFVRDNFAVTHCDHDMLVEEIIRRFENDLCKRRGETADDVFVRFFSSFVNGRLNSKKHVAEVMCREHRYLQNEMFKVCLEYIKLLAENCEKGWFDPRNQYAAQTSKKIIDYLKEIDYPY